MWETDRGTRVAVTTGVSDQERLRRMEDLKPTAIIFKPVNLVELLKIVA